MAKFYVVALTREEVAGRGLSQIADAIREEFFSTTEALRSGQIPNPKELWAMIRFEDPLTSSSFQSEFKDYFSVLYINEIAKQILESKRVSLRVIKEVEKAPEETGIFISMPIFTS